MIDDNENKAATLGQPVNTPKVDEALEATRADRVGGADVLATQELNALKAEVARIRESVSEVTSASGRLTRTGAIAIRDDIEERVRARPIAAVAIAALIGYVWGATR